MKDDIALHRRVEAFLFLEAHLIDRQAWEDWNRLFAPEGVYWVPASPDQPDPIEHVSLIYDTASMRDIRVRRLKNNDAASLHPGVTSIHHISNVVVTATGAPAGPISVASCLIVAQHSHRGMVTFHARCVHVLRDDTDGGFAILSKRVDLLGAGSALGDILTIL